MWSVCLLTSEVLSDVKKTSERFLNEKQIKLDLPEYSSGYQCVCTVPLANENSIC